MPRPKTLTLTGSGSGTTNTTPYRIDWRNSDISLYFSTDGSTTGFTAQYTGESPDDYASASAWATGATWYDHDTIDGVTANANGGLQHPVQGVRLQADANGTDTGTLIIIQGREN